MSNFSDYAEYRKQKPNYKNWKNERDQKLANKVDYIKTNPIDKDEFNNDVERAKVILNAVNIMDEYSQSRAEEMEQVSTATVSLATEAMSIPAMMLAGLTAKLVKLDFATISKISKDNLKDLKKIIPVGIAYMAPIVAFSTIGQIWAAKKEIQASREGRQESMEKDLASVKQFAILSEAQQKEVEQIAQGIEVSEKDSKKIIQKQNKIGVIPAIKTIFKKDDSEKYLADVKMNNDKLSDEQILEAKKDKELIQTIVEKIDIASQDYAENTENAVNVFESVLTTGGVLTGILANFIAGKIKCLAKHKTKIGYALGIGISLASVIYGAKIQKEASRVARFKVKQELMNNPEQLVYVDEEKYKNQNAALEKEEKKGFFAKIAQIIKDNKEYNEHIKQNNANDIKKSRAKEQIKLTEEQEARAQMLQNNVFNMFNKLDEKSQRYSESAEAVGAISTNLLGSCVTVPAAMLSAIPMVGGKSKTTKVLGAIGYMSSLIFSIVMGLLITKDQKNASRVANMEAINELNDYRYFASSKIKSNDKNKAKESQQQEVVNSNNNLSPMLQKMLKK